MNERDITYRCYGKNCKTVVAVGLYGSAGKYPLTATEARAVYVILDAQTGKELDHGQFQQTGVGSAQAVMDSVRETLKGIGISKLYSPPRGSGSIDDLALEGFKDGELTFLASCLA